MLLEATKLILAQNNLHIGSLKKKDIETLNIHPAKAQVNRENDMLTRLCGELLR
jgi:hypothetical protein